MALGPQGLRTTTELKREHLKVPALKTPVARDARRRDCLGTNECLSSPSEFDRAEFVNNYGTEGAKGTSQKQGSVFCLFGQLALHARCGVDHPFSLMSSIIIIIGGLLRFQRLRSWS